MHLLTFLEIRQPGFLFRATVMLTQVCVGERGGQAGCNSGAVTAGL